MNSNEQKFCPGGRPESLPWCRRGRRFTAQTGRVGLTITQSARAATLVVRHMATCSVLNGKGLPDALGPCRAKPNPAAVSSGPGDAGRALKSRFLGSAQNVLRTRRFPSTSWTWPDLPDWSPHARPVENKFQKARTVEKMTVDRRPGLRRMGPAGSRKDVQNNE